MTSLIDRYIAKQYLLSILALYVILFSFVVTIDVSINIDWFWRLAGERDAPDGDAGLVRQSIVTSLLIADFWWPKLLQLFNLMLGLVLTGAMGFTCTQIVRNRELVAVLASGQSLYRVARPILIIAGVMTLLAGLNQELVIPRIAPLLAREHDQAGLRHVAMARIPLVRDNKDRLWYAQAFDPGTKTLKEFDIIERNELGVGTTRITGHHAEWDGKAWACDNATVEALGDAGTTQVGVPIRIETDLDPVVLVIRRFASYSNNLSWRQLSQLQKQTRSGDKHIRDRLIRTQFGRISVAMTNLISLVLVMPFFIVRMPVNLAAQSFKGALVGVVALIGGTIGATAPVAGVSPMASVFLPVIVLLPMTVAMVMNPKT